MKKKETTPIENPEPEVNQEAVEEVKPKSTGSVVLTSQEEYQEAVERLNSPAIRATQWDHPWFIDLRSAARHYEKDNGLPAAMLKGFADDHAE